MHVTPASERPPAPAEHDSAARGLGRDELRSLYERQFGFVWRNLRRLGVPELLAEDAAQDVFLIVHRRSDSFDARWSRLETWLFGIVLRVAHGYRRSERRRLARFDPLVEATSVAETQGASRDQPEEQAAQREAVALLEQLLATLEHRKRAVLVMVELEGFTVPEAAEALGVNVNTAYWRLREARAEFERGLAKLQAQRGIRR